MKEIAATIRIGKNGITPNLIGEISKQLKKKKIKVKILGSFVKEKDKKEIANEVALKTGSRLIKMVGFVFALEKGK